MKKLSLWINVVLIAAVVVLYFLHFNGSESCVDNNRKSDSTKIEIDENYSIAYVNFDTLLTNYDMFADKQDELMKKRDESEAELQTKSRSLEKQVADFKNKTQNGLITRTKAQVLQQELGKKEQDLYKLRDQLTGKLSEEEQVMNRQVMYSIMEYLKEYNEDHSYRFILSNSFGGPLLFTDKNLNITSDVLAGLNKKYNDKK
ncbi:MAG: OmpH family outer membrane protein [Bacteroidales bacterium]|jgi:outer membrane protein|nr:OmpH family outer membrane protein [Bacteroidales bacterium]